ncbi:MAG: DnaJ domain-containing protein, partial [Planctomycetales bacterium]|nr:DnaJ domain-containing protein [Planctomycetales bacterium]
TNAPWADMAEDHYSTLGVSRSATADEIQAAYRKLARKYHPDLNAAPEAKEKFQQVQKAFEVLNDPQKREMYDRYGSAYESMGAGGPRQPWPGGSRTAQGAEINLEDLFGGGFGGFADFLKKQTGGRGRTQQRRTESPPGENVQVEATIPFATAILGGERQVSLQGPTGEIETLQVKIPAGVEEGQKIRLRGRGRAAGRGGKRGDAMLVVHVAPHPHFRRSGKRLDVVVPIALREALEGGKIDVPTPHGVITLTVPPGSSSGKRLRVKGHGVRPATGEPGDLYAELQIMLPDALSEQQRVAILAAIHDVSQEPRKGLHW